jgi:hypothetical protein
VAKRSPTSRASISGIRFTSLSASASATAPRARAARIPTSGGRVAAGRTMNDGAETVSASPRESVLSTPTRSKSADITQRSNARRTRVRDQTEKNSRKTVGWLNRTG